MGYLTGCPQLEVQVSDSGHDHSTPVGGVELTRLLVNVADVVRLPLK